MIKKSLMLFAALAVMPVANGAYTAPDPLDMRWTFGAHEPYTMYRRMGIRSTGGIYGNAYWLRDWFKWWDSEDCPKLMESLGLNWLLCRFYKGMGWEEEKKDFPNVKRFVENCHKHGVKAVAYVQFSTMYPETMKREIPNLEDWAARRADGSIYYYSRYFRWEPCFNEPAFEEYLKKMIRIALTEGKFDGVFFDNAYMKPCYCGRCKKLFHEHLQTIPDPADRFGFDSLEAFGMPEYPKLPWGEVREPLLQEFNVWRTKRMTALFRRFYEYAHSVRPDCVVAANICPYRAPNTVGNKSVDMTELPKCFDLVMGQINNCPHMEGDVIVSRVRDLKYAREFAATYFASCDGAAGDIDNEVEASYMLPLIEDLVFGGVPADRTIMAPYPEKPEFVNHARLERRRPMLAAFNAFAKANREMFAAKDWMPVRFLVSQSAMMHSQLSFDSLMAAEEVALRGHVPFGYAISTDADPLPHADDAAVMIVANQTCLSDRQVAALAAYAQKGGRLVCTGESGRYDEWNRQRFTNPLKDAVAKLANVSWRDAHDVVVAKRITGMQYAFHPPVKGVRPLLDDMAKTGWHASVEVVSAPESLFAQYKQDAAGNVCSVHLVNYVFLKPVAGVRLRIPVGKSPRFSAPFDDVSPTGEPREVEPGVWELPPFTKYAFCQIEDGEFVPGGEGVKARTRDGFTCPPNSTCAVECEAKRCGSGTVLFGTSEANLDNNDGWTGWKRKRFIFRTPATQGKQTFRYGTFNAPAGAMFRSMSACPVKAIYADCGGIMLGHGETVDGDTYSFETQLGAAGHNDARPLVSWSNTYFNSMRWCIRSASEIVYRHDLAGRRFLSGEISVGAIHKGGSFAVEASGDGHRWSEVIVFTNAQMKTAALPASIFPTKEIFIRIKGRKSCSLQVNHYGLVAKFEGPRAHAAGSTRYVDDSGKVLAESDAPVLYGTSYGEQVAKGGGAVCWQASSGWKVARRRALSSAVKKGITMCLAANEAESVQLVVSPTKDLADVRLACGGLSAKQGGAPLPAAAIEIRRVGYVRVAQPTDEKGCRGEWPDPLPDQTSAACPVQVGCNQPFWITVTVPKDTPKGVYSGELSVAMTATDGKRETIDVPFDVEVFGFSLPDVATLKSSFGINPLLVAKWHHARTIEERRKVYDRYMRGFSAYRISPGRPAPFDFWEPKWDKSAGADHPEKWEPVFDWTQWDAGMERAFSLYRFNAFNMKPWRFWSGFGEAFRKSDIAGIKPDNPAYMTLMRKYLRAVGDHLREKGWTDKAYIYWYDEPTEKTYVNVMEGMALLKETMPGVKRLLTEQPEKELLGGVDIWCPMPQFLHTQHEAACRAAGDEFWWYLCCSPRAPYFTEFIDHAGVELRLWGWASWKSGMKGLLMWETTYWTSGAAYPDPAHPQNPYADPMGWVSLGQMKAGEKRPWGNGDGRFFYPPLKCVETAGDTKAAFIDEDPVPTQRLALIRDAVEDYEYLAILKRLDPSNPLLVVPPDICVSDTQFNIDPSAIETHRLKVAREIERLSAGR